METRYSRIEKVLYATIFWAWWLWLYFQAHSTMIFTYQPLKTLLQWSDTSKRMAKWAIELGEFDISYQPRASIKAQVLADFMLNVRFSKINKQNRDLKKSQMET